MSAGNFLYTQLCVTAETCPRVLLIWHILDVSEGGHGISVDYDTTDLKSLMSALNGVNNAINDDIKVFIVEAPSCDIVKRVPIILY